MCYLLLSGGDVLQLSDALIDGVVVLLLCHFGQKSTPIDGVSYLPEKYIFTYKNNI